MAFEPFKIKYELCEIILCKVNSKLKNVGITVMDGPFFSIMPFGKTGYHSLTSVTFTPHVTCHKDFPEFECQKNVPEEPSFAPKFNWGIAMIVRQNRIQHGIICQVWLENI